jgi:TetR/AcrR family transcriptional regulator, transcriptional repressor of aconitase
MPKIVDHDAYRQTITMEAMQLFVAHGYEGLGMRALAEHLSISKSALYHYFPSKEALFLAIVEAVVALDMAELLAVPAGSFAQRLDAFLQMVSEQEDWILNQILVLMEYARVREGQEGAALLQEAFARYVTGIAAYLDIEEGPARALYLQVSGAILQRHLDGRRSNLREALAWQTETLIANYQEKGNSS